jgi:hypothetical protein
MTPSTLELKFNLKSDGLHSFIEKFKNGAWNVICIIPVAPAVAVPASISIHI